jgi:hypothetical protein
MLTGGLIASIAIWSAWPESGPARASVLLLALAGTALALLVHESGHLAAACFCWVRLRPVWPGKATLMSLLLLPFGATDGPFPGHVAVPGTPFRRAQAVYLAGAVANVAVGALFYGLYHVQPMPALRLLAEFQLGVAAFAMLPIRPLDAAAFRRHPGPALWLIPLALITAVAGFAFRVGLL